MVFHNSEKRKTQKFLETLHIIKLRGHEYREGKYQNKNSVLVLFCPVHQQVHETIFYSYKISKVGLPCCSRELKSRALQKRIFSDETLQKMKKSTTKFY